MAPPRATGDRPAPPARSRGPLLVALAAATWVASSALLTGAFTDWEVEAQAPAQALLRGDAGAWAAALPAYAGGMTLRAPGMALGGVLGGGDLDWVFRLDALPALLALVLLGTLLADAALRRGIAPLGALLIAGLAVGSPTVVRTISTGHPEELVGGVLCVAAVVIAARAASRGGVRTELLAGALTGLAVANKPWAVLLVLPVLAVLPGTAARARALAAAAAAGALLLAPSTLLGSAHVTAVATAGDASIFKPGQLFWFLGEPGHVQPSPFGPIADRRAGPAWTGLVSHPLIVVVGAALAAAWWWRRRPGRRDAPGALLLLAAILWWRCLLDTWNADYYLGPALLCLLAAAALRGRPPWAALVATALAALTAPTPSPLGLGSDAATALHLAWAAPFGAWLTVRALHREGRTAPSAPVRPAQPTSTSALSRPVVSTR